MRRFQQMTVAVQYAPRLDGALLVQRCEHATGDVVELVSKGP
ncbi:hypothetical protein [Bradyrhizobium sp. McL0616]